MLAEQKVPDLGLASVVAWLPLLVSSSSPSVGTHQSHRERSGFSRGWYLQHRALVVAVRAIGPGLHPCFQSGVSLALCPLLPGLVAVTVLSLDLPQGLVLLCLKLWHSGLCLSDPPPPPSCLPAGPVGLSCPSLWTANPDLPAAWAVTSVSSRTSCWVLASRRLGVR